MGSCSPARRDPTAKAGRIASLAIVDNLSAFRAALPARGSLLALDASKRRLGIAGTDLERRLVVPLATLSRDGWARDLDNVRRLMRGRDVVGLVVGWPVNMDGTVGPMARRARELAGALARALALPTFLQDERLTTFAVEDAIAEGRVPRPKRGEPRDHLAAAVILEDCLRAMRALPEPGPPSSP